MYLSLLIHAVLIGQISASCSYDDSSLLNWDDPAAWENHVPAEGEFAVIKTGSKVRLNVSPTLKGITIESGATLVWGNFDGLVVTTDHIHVKGTFIIGDSDCPFTNRANIKLTGKSNTDNVIPKFGRKFIGVDAGGTLEIHGRPKKSWSQLIQTVPRARDSCGTLFNLKDTLFDLEGLTGLMAFVFNLDGSIYDSGFFTLSSANDAKVHEEFQDFVERLPVDKVLMMAVNQQLGVGSVERDWETVYSAVETVGGLDSSVIRDVQGLDAYAFVTRTGHPETTREQHVPNTSGTKVSTERQSYYDETTGLYYHITCNVYSWKSRENDVQVLHKDVATPKIKLFHDVSTWLPGDNIIVTSTDFDWRQVEEFKLVDCTDCDDNEVRLDHEFTYMHYGEITQGVDERAEVGMLSQSILIEGIVEDHCYDDADLCEKFDKDMHGGHIKIIKDFAAAHIENAELVHMGQQKFLGSYALHFHMCDDVDGNWFRSNSIHHCLSRCVTIHGSDGAEVSNNVCYLTHGHSFFLEDSVEQRTILDGNLGLGTMNGNILMSDKKKEWCDPNFKQHCNGVSTFWITHPNNHVINNHAAGSDDTGIWYIVSLRPLGPSRERQITRQTVPDQHAYHSPVLEFDNNTAHSNFGRGFRYDATLSSGETYIFRPDIFVEQNGIFHATIAGEPRDPPRANGTLTTSVMKRFTSYKNRNQNVWTKVGNLRMEQFTVADCMRGLSMAKGEAFTYTEVTKSLFIGETDNIGLPEEPFGRSDPYKPGMAIQGIEFYQGPAIVTDSFFDKYVHKNASGLFRAAGAIGHKRDTPYPAAPASGTRGLLFGYCDAPDTNWLFRGYPPLHGFSNQDGNRQANIHDYDGSLSGTPGAQLVPRDRFFTTDRCLDREYWNMAVCPYGYVRSLFYGTGGAFETNFEDYAMSMRRDDRPDDPFSITGIKGNNYLMIKEHSYTAYFNGSNPNNLRIVGHNYETGDSVRIGLCYTSDSEFTFSGSAINHQNPPIEVTSIADLDSDTTGRAYFWDQPRGLLFIKLIGTHPADPDEPNQCPGGEHTCPKFIITRTSGSDNTADCYQAAYGDGTYTKPEDTSTPIPGLPVCTSSTKPEEWGAPALTSNYPTDAFFSTCPALPSYPEPQYVGCYIDKSSYRDLPHEMTELSRSMTIEFCAQRCYQRNYVYAALQNGLRCLCGNMFGGYGEDPDACTKTCPGDGSPNCGEFNMNSVYTTGIDPLPELTPCGPDDTGVLQEEGVCLYLTGEALTYTDAQGACAQLGGNLATINSQEIQTLAERYLRPKMVDAWFGLNDIAVEGTFTFIDGTPYDGSFNNVGDGLLGANWEDGFTLQASVLYAWNDRNVMQLFQGLCQIPTTQQTQTNEACGVNGLGQRIGSGSCYAVVNSPLVNYKQAEYACYTRMGTIVQVDDSNRDEVLQHITMFGDSLDYWTAKKYYILSHQNMYAEVETTSGKKAGVVCLLETDLTNKCSTGWAQVGDKCYLYTGQWVGNLDKALSFCRQGASDVASIHSQAENDFLSTLMAGIKPGHAYIGFQYSTASSSYEWLDGSSVSFTNWRSGHGETNIANGECATFRSEGMEWRNKACGTGAFALCQADVGQ